MCYDNFTEFWNAEKKHLSKAGITKISAYYIWCTAVSGIEQMLNNYYDSNDIPKKCNYSEYEK